MPHLLHDIHERGPRETVLEVVNKFIFRCGNDGGGVYTPFLWTLYDVYVQHV